MSPAERTEYAHAVWQAYCQKYGVVEWRMSSNDWNVIRGWMDRRVPLRNVLRGISDAGEKGRTLSYCVPSVEQEAEHAMRAIRGY